MLFLLTWTFFTYFWVLSHATPPLCDTPLTTPSLTIANNSGWWCAKDNTAGQAVTSATQYDSCFCVWFQPNAKLSDASAGCSGFGGYVTSVLSQAENDLLNTLITQAYAQVSSSNPEFSLWIGLQALAMTPTWNKGCDSLTPPFDNSNPDIPNTSMSSAYTYDVDQMWSPNPDPMNGVANGYICRKERDPCAGKTCSSGKVCTVKYNCGICLAPPPIPPPMPLCNSTSSNNSWWCAANNTLVQTVPSAVATQSCFCYYDQSSTSAAAMAECASQGGYLSDIRSAAENTLAEQLATAASAVYCDAGWSLFNGSCYQIEPDKKNYTDAEAFCVSQGGHLISIHTLQEFEFSVLVADMFLISGGKIADMGFWTGALKSGTTFTYSDGTSYDYVLPVYGCKAYGAYFSTLTNPVYLSIMPLIPCGHTQGDDILNPFCKKPAKPSNFWIGLQGDPALGWNKGCEINRNVAYTNAATCASGTCSYVHKPDGTWILQDPATAANGAMCRKDLNPCGANNCTVSAQCTNSGNCFVCPAESTSK